MDTDIIAILVAISVATLAAFKYFNR